MSAPRLPSAPVAAARVRIKRRLRMRGVEVPPGICTADLVRLALAAPDGRQACDDCDALCTPAEIKRNGGRCDECAAPSPE